MINEKDRAVPELFDVVYDVLEEAGRTDVAAKILNKVTTSI